MSRKEELRQQALRQLEQFEVLMRGGHFDYGNGFHGRVYLNAHQLFRHPSTIWRLAQDLLEVLPGELLGQTEVVAGPVMGGALLAHTLAGLLDGRRALTHPPCSFAPFTSRGDDDFSLRSFYAREMQGKRVLVTAGPTYEAIDAVRGITNSSSGKMGYAVARAALQAGADVTLISGPVCLQSPAAARLINVVSARDMLAAVKNEVSRTDIFVSVAAVADYHAATTSKQKIKKTGGGLALELTPNPDILEYVANLPQPPFCVGFAAETENLERNAAIKRRKKKLPLLAANLAQDAIGSDESTLTLFDDEGKHPLAKASKIEQAQRLIQHIATLYEKRKS